jgi:hypothetical protein
MYSFGYSAHPEKLDCWGLRSPISFVSCALLAWHLQGSVGLIFSQGFRYSGLHPLDLLGLSSHCLVFFVLSATYLLSPLPSYCSLNTLPTRCMMFCRPFLNFTNSSVIIVFFQKVLLYICLLWIEKTRAKEKTYKWGSVRWETKN